MSASIAVPPELQNCLREYTKAVLRDKPESADLLLYSKDFFTEKAQQIRMQSYSLPPSTSKPFSELSMQVQQQIGDVFKRYDVDCDLSISLEELRNLMSDLGGLFGFSEEVDASTLMALLDADGSQDISWQVRATRPLHRPRNRARPLGKNPGADRAARHASNPAQEWSHACAVWLADENPQ